MGGKLGAVRLPDWQVLTSLGLGLWLVLSPWALRYAEQSHVATEVAWVIGAMLVVMGVLASVALQFPEGVVECVTGVGLAISPWELDYAAALVPTINALATGLLLVLLSLATDWREGSSVSEQHARVRKRGRAHGAGMRRHGNHA